MRILGLLLAFCFFFFLGCKEDSTQETVKVEIPRFTPNDLDYPDSPIIVTDSVKKHFLEMFFGPWNKTVKEVLATISELPGKEASYLQLYLEDDDWYGVNKKNHQRAHREAIVSNVDFATYPNLLKKGITIAHTDLRRIPSKKPGFAKYSNAGEGYPFDYFQETGLWANTPLFLAHLSKDRQWCYAVSPYYKGWVAMNDIAFVDDALISKWMSFDYCVPLSDDISLVDSDTHYAQNAKIGMVLPYSANENTTELTVRFANGDANRRAVIKHAKVPRSLMATDDFKANETTLKRLVTNLMGKPYGWGGSLENRDCSSLIRDLWATYRVWLPRDSKDQMNVGQRVELKGSGPEKIRLIKERAIPFRTILRKKGHNMLYVGNNAEGMPLIFHAIWGLKTIYAKEDLIKVVEEYPVEGLHRNDSGFVEGRYIIGESVITAVNAGEGKNAIAMPIIEEIYAMTTILKR